MSICFADLLYFQDFVDHYEHIFEFSNTPNNTSKIIHIISYHIQSTLDNWNNDGEHQDYQEQKRKLFEIARVRVIE